MPSISSDGILSISNKMTITNKSKIKIFPLRLHSASSVRIPNSLLPTVNVTPLKLHSTSSINLHAASKAVLLLWFIFMCYNIYNVCLLHDFVATLRLSALSSALYFVLSKLAL